MIKLLFSWVGVQDLHKLVKNSPVGPLSQGPRGVMRLRIYNFDGLLANFCFNHTVNILRDNWAALLTECLCLSASILRLCRFLRAPLHSFDIYELEGVLQLQEATEQFLDLSLVSVVLWLFSKSDDGVSHRHNLGRILASITQPLVTLKGIGLPNLKER